MSINANNNQHATDGDNNTMSLQTHEFTIRFTIGKDTEHYGEAKTLHESLHEALCQAIHEDGERAEAAINWLNDNVASCDMR